MIDFFAFVSHVMSCGWQKQKVSHTVIRYFVYISIWSIGQIVEIILDFLILFPNLVWTILFSHKNENVRQTVYTPDNSVWPIFWWKKLSCVWYHMVMWGSLNGPLDVNLKDNCQRTALWWAACRGHDEIVKFLLDRGADIDAGHEDGATPLMMASRNGHKSTVKVLLSRQLKQGVTAEV